MNVELNSRSAAWRLPIEPLSVAKAINFDDPASKRLRTQIWTGLLLVHIFIVVISRIVRLTTADASPEVPFLNQLLFVSMVVLASLGVVLRNSQYAEHVYGAYTLLIHLITPVILWSFGGTQGFGDIASMTAFVLALLYGFRRWMLATGSVIVLTLLYLIYLDAIGQPVATSIVISPQLLSLKLTATIALLVMVTYFINAFYRNLLNKYSDTQRELEAANSSLMHNEQELKQLAEDLQRSRRQIVTTRAEEQRRLSHDLHDGLGPTLAAQIFRVGAIRNNLHKDLDKSAELLIGLERAIDGTLADVRRLVYDLRPPMLDQLGLRGAITHFAGSYDAVFTIELDLADDMPLLNAATEVAAFRIVQTAVDNVAQHAEATHCTVSLSAEAGQLNLAISDNGVGIAPGRLNGVGLTSMCERSEELDGTFEVRAHKPSGTAIVVSLPIHIESEFDD